MRREKRSVHLRKHQLEALSSATGSYRASSNRDSCPLLVACAAESTPGPIDGGGDAANAQGANQPQMFSVAPGAAGLTSFNGPRILISIIPFEPFQRRRAHEGEFILFYYCQTISENL